MAKFPCFLGFVFSVFLFSQIAQTAEPPEYRAVWVAAWQPGCLNQEEVTKLVSDVRKANCNLIFLQIRKRGDVLYDGNPFKEPKARNIDKDFDPLKAVISAAHDPKAGPRIEVHAWFVVYPITTQANLKSKPGPIPSADLFDEPHPYNLHKDWLCQSENGATFDGKNYHFDPGHPGVQNYLYTMAMDLISRYDLDGFHFDKFRYPGREWGYNPVAVQRFNKIYQRSGKPSQNDPQWNEFRRNQITELLRKIYFSALEKRPNVRISASTILWTPGITSDQQWPSTSAYKDSMQDWVGWMQEGILDMNVAMNFFRENKPVYAQDFRDWNGFLKDHKYERHLIIGLGNFLNSTADSTIQIKSSMEPSLKTNKADGIAIYSYSDPAAGEKDFVSTTIKYSNFSGPSGLPAMPWKTKIAKNCFKGVVFGQDGTNGLDGAKIELTGPISKQFQTDASGFFGCWNLPPGKYKATITSAGYQTKTNEIVVVESSSSVQKFSLSKSGTQ